VYECMCVSIWVYVCGCMYVCSCMYVCIFVCMYVCMCVCMFQLEYFNSRDVSLSVTFVGRSLVSLLRIYVFI